VGQRVSQPLKLPKGEHNCGIGWAHGMEQITGDDNGVWPGGNDAVNGGAKGLSQIGFPLIDACRGLPVVLPDAQVGVRDVGQFHGWRMGAKAVKSKNLPSRFSGFRALVFTGSTK
jgi:hypothetical protein